MTLLSMTGFGAGRAEALSDDGARVVCSAEVKTVNHRHLQAKIRMAPEYSALEPDLDKLVRSKLGRGAVQVAIDVTRSGGEPGVTVDDAAAERYAALQGSLAERFGLEPLRRVQELLSLPGVVVTAQAERGAFDPAGAEAGAIRDALAAALDALLDMRRVEGEAMARDLRKNGEAIADLVKRIEERVPGIVASHKARLQERVAELVEVGTVTEGDLAREIALMADRLDVSEELARLHSHLGQLDSLLAAEVAVGRKLDFLAQEFFREANTIGSKCSDAAVAHLVVDLKTHVERLREQVQNIE